MPLNSNNAETLDEETVVFNIDEEGRISFIWNDEFQDLRSLGDMSIRRVSHVEPVGDKFQADLSPVNGPTFGPYDTRGEALAAEIKWLNDNIFSTV